LDRRTAIESVLVKDHEAHAQARHRRHFLLFATPAGAGPLEDADAAIKRRNYTTAVRLIRPLAEQGDANAQYKLGVFYDNGLGVPQDKVRAYMWLNLSAAQGTEKVRQLFETLSHGA
jgi:TPR repeat protein